ncbi:MAG: neutral/alkaline non-lysosomal ceramidase N-terminal domain-containing protein [Bryobacteraceae bacterium]
MKTFLLLFVSAACAAAQSAEWKVGLASTDITPTEPIPMGGYANRTAPFEAVEAPLFAKVLALEDSTGTKAVIITADLLGFTRERTERIAARLQSSDGIARKNILINASHTHSGPLVSGSMLLSAPVAMRSRMNAYIESMESKIIEAAQKALHQMTPAQLSWGSGVAKFVMNRREFTSKGIILGTNARGPADRTVPVLRIDDPSGRLRAVVFGAGSHNTTLTGDNMRVSGDYAGFAQLYLQSRRPGVQAMFLTGCAGDANPYPRGTFDLARRHASELADEVTRVLEAKLAPVRGPLRAEFRDVDLPLERLTKSQIEQMAKGAPSYRQFFTDGALDRLNKGGTLLTSYKAPFALWQFGQDLTLVAYSGETLVDYAIQAERLLGPLQLWVSGYNNDVFGYLPPARVLAEGGYETRGLYADYGLFTPDVERTVLKAIEEMARAAGRR